MNNNSNSHIISIYKSRKHLLDILENRDFDTSSYKDTSISEIGILTEQDQLDMLLENKQKKKVYVKYYISKVLKSQNIYAIVEDLFHLEQILSKSDDLIIIIKEEPNETLIQVIKDIWMSDNIYISLLNIKRLQFNILNHTLVPKHSVLSNTEVEEFKLKYNIIDNSQIPTISYFSPVSLVLGIRPNDIVKIERNSRTSIYTNYYRICKI